MNKYEILYMDWEMTIIDEKTIQASSIMDALRVMTITDYPAGTVSVSVIRKEDEI